MKQVFQGLAFASALALSGQAFAINHPALRKSEADFSRYIRSYETPEFLDDNEVALQARLKLLDQVPAGGTAKILTFVYDNGESTRLLAAHMCLAVKRGVSVQFLPDSKNGDRPGVPDAFDGAAAHQMNEEVYQMLANCGVQVRIHNHISQFDRINRLDKHLPVIPRTWTGAALSYVWNDAAVATSLKGLVGDFETVFNEAIEAEAKLAKIDRDSLAQLGQGLKRLLLTSTVSIASSNGEDERIAAIFSTLEEVQKEMAATGLVKRLPPLEVRRFLFGLLERVQSHPRLGAFYREARVFNRLNHRKLFLVEYRGQSCMLLGGRNLGDHYLTWKRHNDEFMDGDVLICNHHLQAGRDSDAIGQARASFNQLWFNQDLEDALGVAPQLTRIQPNNKFEYRYLVLPDHDDKNWGNPMWVIQPYDRRTDRWAMMNTYASRSATYADLSVKDRSIPAPTTWTDAEPLRGHKIEGARAWRVKTSTWNTQRDEVRKELVDAIKREQQYAYIETAYSEFNSELRTVVEDALKRGVQVKLVTNSIFVADAGSKAIRLVMARWTRQLLERYPQRLVVSYATIEHGHMIHFKGASFQCQKRNDDLFRLNLVGSHNFHGRSGYSDKEHAIIWEQTPRRSCRDKVGIAGEVGTQADLMNMRQAFYRDILAKGPVAPLKLYRTLEDEFRDAIRSGKLSPKREKVARAVLMALYATERGSDGKLRFVRDAAGRALLKRHDEFVEFLEMLSESGVSDLIGALL